MNLRKNSIFVTTGALLKLGLTLASIPILVRYLGLGRYGIWMVLNSIMAIMVLMEIGLTSALTYYVSTSRIKQDMVETKNGLSTSLIMITGFGVISSLGLWMASHTIINILFGNDYLGRMEALPTLSILSASLVLRLCQQWAMAVEAAWLRYDLQTVVDTAGGLLLQGGIIIIALAKGSISSLAVWTLIIALITLIGHYLVLKNLQIIKMIWFHFSLTHAKNLIRFGMMQWLSNIGSTIFSYADRIIVNLLLGTEAAGIYAAATGVAVQINSLSAIPLRVIPPAISAAKALFDQSRIQQIFLKATKYNSIFVFLLSTPIMFWSTPIAKFLVGQESVITTAKMLQILAIVYGIYSLNSAAFFTAIGAGHPVFNARWSIISGIIFCLLLFILIKLFGLQGAAWANLAFAITLMINFQVIRLLKISYFEYFKSIFPVIMLIGIWGFISQLVDSKLQYSLLRYILIFIILGIISILLIGGYAFIREIINSLITVENNKLKLKKIF